MPILYYNRITRFSLALLLLCASAVVPALPPSANHPGNSKHYPEHREITETVATGMGFSEEEQKVLWKGAMAPDDFDWDTPAAHGQTPNDADGKIIGIPEVAKAQAFPRRSSKREPKPTNSA
jgi:hypothetical protein